jgi:8-oxo-dGTP pyrophosphatase MutT (NUDIX family)
MKPANFKLPADSFPILQTPYNWGPVTSMYVGEPPTQEHAGNVHVVPFVGDSCVIMHAVQSGWSMPGGTLLADEPLDIALRRELMEEIGAELLDYQFFGAWESKSSLREPYRPHLPHPDFAIALGWADVQIVDSPSSDDGIEMETITEIVLLPIESAIQQLEKNDRHHLAAVYALAAQHRAQYKSM